MHPPLWVVAITLVLAGSLWLPAGIRRLINWAASPLIGKLSAHQQSGPFAVTKAGKYAIWWGAIGERWLQVGREAFGYPITDEVTINNGHGRFNHFQAIQLPGKPVASIY